MAVHLIERYASVALAAQCAKAMLIDTSEKVQAPYQSLVLSETSGDPAVSSAQYWLQTHLQEPVDQAGLAQKIGVSQRTLIRRFNTELGVPPLIYLQNCRIEAAKQLLENTALPLVAVIEQVGYTDISSFSRLFKKRTGLTPAAYRKRFPTD
jgi:transcriptional regulator GlxA family with amidase domain